MSFNVGCVITPGCTKQPFNPQQSVVSKESLYPLPLSLPSSPTGCCLAIFRGAADVELVAGTSYTIRLCGLGSLSVAMRSALDWTADTKWAAASSLNCENKYWMGLRCASQASSPIAICLGVHTGGSVCLGLKPPHVVAARFFFHAGSHFLRTHLIKLAAEYEEARIQTNFAHVIYSHISALCPCRRWDLHKQAECISGRDVCFPELKERSLRREDVGHSEEGGKRSTWDRLIWIFGCWRGTCLVANDQLLRGLKRHRMSE